MDLLVATRSAHKISEIRHILYEVPQIRVLDLDDVGIPFDPAEDEIEVYPTFEQNAMAKARYFQERSGIPTAADDSGLEVDALDGAPGVRSKRFSPVKHLTGTELDQANNEYLLQLLGGLPIAQRTARYVCVAVLDTGDGDPKGFRGEASGLILGRPRGWGGFGYDPLFFDRGIGRTFAEIEPEEKNARSHRGKAFRALAEYLHTLEQEDGPLEREGA